MEDFYVTLLSSMDIFPKNTTSAFKVHLQNKITLSENWSVGVAEIHYRHNFFNVTHENNVIVELGNFTEKDTISLYTTKEEIQKYKKEGKYREIIVRPGIYKSVKALIDDINTEFKTPLFKLKPSSGHVKINSEFSGHDIDIVFKKGKLALQLGFRPGHNILLFDQSPEPSSLHFGAPEQMLIYCDVIEPQIIGHEMAQVLNSKMFIMCQFFEKNLRQLR